MQSLGLLSDFPIQGIIVTSWQALSSYRTPLVPVVHAIIRTPLIIAIDAIASIYDRMARLMIVKCTVPSLFVCRCSQNIAVRLHESMQV